MTETQQRFLRAIAERVPMGQVVELHLFPPIRQGGVETGMAVVAEDPRQPLLAVVDSLESSEPTAGFDAAAPEVDSSSADADPLVAEIEAVDLEDTDGGDVDDTDDSEAEDASPYLDDDAAEGIVAENGATNGYAPTPAVSRFIIHTARYRLTLKGVDRGKWEVDVVAQADAPLAALDAVVRGVQRRSGESGAEPDRLTSDAFLEALNAPLASLER
jgi:hypothetical protein